jgi:hypothetical protein
MISVFSGVGTQTGKTFRRVEKIRQDLRGKQPVPIGETAIGLACKKWSTRQANSKQDIFGVYFR